MPTKARKRHHDHQHAGRHTDVSKQGVLRLSFLLYLAFVVYGSLIPFELRPATFEQAVARFTAIPWLDLGPGSRADWVANILLYMPLAFLGCSAIAGRLRSGAARLIAVVFVVAGCIAIAVAVEFTQIFFAPRTVSLNDLLAETLGSIAGALTWLFGRRRLAGLAHAFAAGGRQSVAAAIVAYLLVYVVLALFPFDFAVSLRELSAKLDSDRLGWLFAGNSWVSFRQIARLAGEIIAFGPLGLLAGLLAKDLSLGRTFIAGSLLGAFVEIAQFFVLSGVTQGASILASGAGLVAGAYTAQLIQRHGLQPIARWTVLLSWPLLPPYLLALAAITGWFTNAILPFSQGLRRFDDIQFLPFFFHYFTSEPAAMASLLANAVMYPPIGIFTWARQTAQISVRQRRATEAALLAGGIALAFETSKLWLSGKHPDFTNLLIAIAGAVVTYHMASWIGRASSHAAGRPELTGVDR